MENRDDKSQQITRVNIFGSEFALCSSETPEYTQEISEFVHRRMMEIANEQNLGDVTKVAIMTALDIADQLLVHQARRQTHGERAVEALQRLGQHLDGTEKQVEHGS